VANTEMQKIRYYDASEERKRKEKPPKAAIHSEFLRTGRITRPGDDWHETEKRYLTYEEVAMRTGRKLTDAGEKTHDRLNGFHKAIQFPKILFHRTLSERPHLGYCHVTAARTKFAEYDDVRWAFYIANFFADIGAESTFFDNINLNYSRMYFAVAMDLEGEEKRMVINRKVRGNGLLFRTHDPKTAMKNVLLLGAKHEELRKIIRSIQ